jgi:urea transport system substrate-binding protein
VEAGGEIVGERCLPIGDTDVSRIVAEVAARRPDFILSNMLGPSSHAFLRAIRELGGRDPTFRPERCPVVSCDLTECELSEIGLGVADGQLAAASYFDSLDSIANRALKEQVAARFGSERRVSSYFATSYATVRLCVEALTRCGTDDPIEVRSALADLQTPSPLGPLRIDPATNHANLPFLLGRISGADFVILQSRPAAVADPYLIRKRTIAQPRSPQPQLRVVS